MTLAVSLQKNSLDQQKENLKNNPFVQAPLSIDVHKILHEMDFSKTYYSRGNGAATKDFNDIEEVHRKWISEIIDLSSLPHIYPTAGATEAINLWRLTDSRPWQYLKGDYSWPQLISKNGVQVTQKDLRSDHVLYLSNPSSIDGNFLEDSYIDYINTVGCPVILDCAYIGATKVKKIKSIKNLEQVFFSFSKGWGLIGYRLGIMYTSTPHKTLKLMKRVECWNYPATIIMRSIMENFSVHEMFDRNKSKQVEICESLGLEQSDTFFIANSIDSFFGERFRSAEKARLCLSDIWSFY